MIYHVWTDYIPKDRETLRRNHVAQETWEVQPWMELPVRDEELPRMWTEEGRQFAYIRDVFTLACVGKRADDIILYTNADIHVRSDCSLAVSLTLTQADACYSYRRDFEKLTSPLEHGQFEGGKAYEGSDLAAFRVDWWFKHQNDMPDMILGMEAWDPCFRHLVDMTNPGRTVSIKDIIGHERHGSYWERKENRYRLKGQLLCRRMAKDWLQRHGVNPQMHGL